MCCEQFKASDEEEREQEARRQELKVKGEFKKFDSEQKQKLDELKQSYEKQKLDLEVAYKREKEVQCPGAMLAVHWF